MTNEQLVVYIILAMLLFFFVEFMPYIILVAVIYTIWIILAPPRFSERFLSVVLNHPVSINSFYSDIDDNIAYGNPQSWSNKMN